MYATKPAIAAEFAAATPSIAALPKKKKSSKYDRMLNRKTGYSGSHTEFGGTGGGGGMGYGGGMEGA
jgi:hypothetical protein